MWSRTTPPRRNELDYPSSDEDFADDAEARAAIARATHVVDDAHELLERGVLTVFQPNRVPGQSSPPMRPGLGGRVNSRG